MGGRCHARDKENRRCTDTAGDEHPRVITRDRFWALSHHTRVSWWVERTIQIAPKLTVPPDQRERR